MHNMIEFALCTVIVLTIIYTYEYFRYVAIPGYKLDVPQLYLMVCLVSQSVCSLIVYMNYLFTVNIIQKRVRLIRHAVETFDKFSNRNIAWSDRVIVCYSVFQKELPDRDI